MYDFIHGTFRKLPPSWRTRLKRTLGAEGHGASPLDRLTARKDATGKKRLDRALDSVIDTLTPNLAASLAGTVCIDFGSGYVPSDGVVLHLLGAEAVYGVDYNSIARPQEVARAIRGSDFQYIRRKLEQLNAPKNSYERLAALIRWSNGDTTGFPPRYEYLAPLDVVENPRGMPEFDVLLSTSVLEHIRPSLMSPMLDALKSREKPEGVQVHKVDLRDHRDFEHNPYGFLAVDSGFDPESEADVRGNGMTYAEWNSLIGHHPEWNFYISRYEEGDVDLLPEQALGDQGSIIADSLILRTRV